MFTKDGFLLWLPPMYLVLVGSTGDKAQRPSTLIAGIILVSVKRADDIGDMMTGVGDGQLAGVAAPVGKAVANIAAGTRRGLSHSIRVSSWSKRRGNRGPVAVLSGFNVARAGQANANIGAGVEAVREDAPSSGTGTGPHGGPRRRRFPL